MSTNLVFVSVPTKMTLSRASTAFVIPVTTMVSNWWPLAVIVLLVLLAFVIWSRVLKWSRMIKWPRTVKRPGPVKQTVPRKPTAVPMSFVAAYNSGLGHYENGDYDDAIHDYNLALEFDPKNTFTCLVYSNRGVAYRKKGEYDQALADYTQAITLDPNGSQHYCNRGLLHELLGRKGEAIADFEMVIQLQRDAALVQKATQALERLQSREQP